MMKFLQTVRFAAFIAGSVVTAPTLAANNSASTDPDIRGSVKPAVISEPATGLAGREIAVTDTSSHADIVLESSTYHFDFEDRTLGAWAAYPLWQDTAYDPNFRTNEIIPGDPNVSIVQIVRPFSHVDNYAGAQKSLDMYLTPDSEVSFRYYLKTNLDAQFFKARFAAGEYGKVDVTLQNPETNKWVWKTLRYDDFVRENPELAGKDRIKIYALAFLAKIPEADPDMPIYFGLDDIVVKGARATEFRFSEPAVHKLPEFKPYIPQHHYNPGDRFHLSGQWPVDASHVTLQISNLTDEEEIVYEGELRSRDGQWESSLDLSFPEGLYLGRMVAYNGSRRLSDTEFTLHIAPEEIGGQHPRLLFDDEKKARMEEKFQQERFRDLYEEIPVNAQRQRENVPVESLVYDLDQFPDEDWLPTWSAWGDRIYDTGSAVRWNALAYAFHEDREAGEYAKEVLLRLASWPDFAHPWQTKRGRFSEHRTGRWSHPVAEAYDLVHELMNDDERDQIHRALMENIIIPAHRTYVHNDNVTTATSNWIPHVLGGSLMLMAGIFDDGPRTENLEPYFTGAMLKFYKFINRAVDSEDGAYGEGLGYYSSSISNLVDTVPSLYNVFNIDVTDPLYGSYNEYIWGGPVKDDIWFEFGQSGDRISSGRRSSWAFLLEMQDDPLLGWYYHHLKERDTFEDLLFETDDVPRKDPFDENPVKLFRKIGTTVFKSGWETDDLIFTMRTGSFFNHQHHDQGAIWFADKGEAFIRGTRPTRESGRYDDPLFEPHHIQPIGKSTVLIDHNPQSQRIGDQTDFAPGFEDHAFVDHFLDGQQAAFSTGDIGRLYWDKVESLQRNVLYLKPGTILMLDTAVPGGGEDRDVTLLYHTERLADIQAGQEKSTITRGDAVLTILHLSPSHVETEAVETPHLLRTLRGEQPLERSGMLTVTARTDRSEGHPLVMANLFTATEGEEPDIQTSSGEGFVRGTVSGQEFVFSTQPGKPYQSGELETDALAASWSEGILFAARATEFRRGGELVMEAAEPVTFEYLDSRIRYYHSHSGKVSFAMPTRPSEVRVNGSVVRTDYNANRQLITIQLPAGEGEIIVE